MPDADDADDDLTQELFTRLLESSQDMFVMGNGNVIEYESASVHRLLGRSLLGDIDFTTLTHPDDVEHVGECVKHVIEQALATGKVVPGSFEWRVRTNSGTFLWIETRFCFSGTRFSAVWRDCSLAKQYQKCMHDFLATTSHDARTPLSSIQVAAQLLKETSNITLSEDATELLTAVSASARVLLTIVYNVALKKRLDTGECDTATTSVDIRALVADVVRTARVGLTQSGTTIVWDERRQLPESVQSNSDHLQHLLLNLTVFCVRVADGSPVLVRCEVRCCSDGLDVGSMAAPMLLLEVSTQGPALSAEQIDAAFNPYSPSSSAAASTVIGGSHSRLGLHVSRRLAEALGGHLTLHSCDPDNICFTATIPVGPHPGASRASTPSPTLLSSRAPVDAGEAGISLDALPPRLSSSGMASDPGIMPYFPADVRWSESFEQVKQSGRLSELFDVLLTNSPDGFIMGLDETFEFVSPGCLQMLGYSSKDEMCGKKVTMHIHPDDLPQVLVTWDAAKVASAASGGHAVNCMFCSRQQKADGTWLWIETASCITETSWYGVQRDITDRKALEASLKDFLADTMADMRQPLTGIQAASELLAQQPCVHNNEDASFLVAAISAASRMLAGIVSNVLSLRSLEAGECIITSAAFSVREMVDGVLSVCRMSLAHHNNAVIRWLDEDAALPALVLGDSDKLSQVVLNLLTNAVKFADGSDVLFSVDCELDASPGSANDSNCSLLVLRVADGGRGMTAAECELAFEPYFRSPTHKGGGTGLGLYICKRFVETMGGRIDVETAPGHGSRFIVSVPVHSPVAATPHAGVAPQQQASEASPLLQRKASSRARQPGALGFAKMSLAPGIADAHADAQAAGPALSAAPAAPLPQASPRRRVLLVDDHNLNLKLCKRLLEVRGGLEVVTADDGDVALEWLISSYGPSGMPAAFVLLDMQMPRMHGLECAHRFRVWERQHLQLSHRLPIFALSANVFDERYSDCTTAGMDGFLSKPLRLDALQTLLAAFNLL